MRSRKEIEEDSHTVSKEKMILEVLLDIREMIEDWREHADYAD